MAPAPSDTSAAPPSPIPPSLTARPQRDVDAFPGTWVAADWHEAVAPKTFSGFYLPLIFSGLGSGGVLPNVPPVHFKGRRVANAADVAAVQPFWAAAFSRWAFWVAAISAAHAEGRLSLTRGVTPHRHCTTLVPMRVPGMADAWAYGAIPHIKPFAQIEILEAALGPVEAACFYASVMTLFATEEEASES